MKNVSEIINQGNKNAELPAWLNMRHAWSASDAKRDEGLAYPDNVIQIKNLDYKKEPKHCVCPRRRSVSNQPQGGQL